jgi:hypothetical protein
MLHHSPVSNRPTPSLTQIAIMMARNMMRSAVLGAPYFKSQNIFGGGQMLTDRDMSDGQGHLETSLH